MLKSVVAGRLIQAYELNSFHSNNFSENGLANIAPGYCSASTIIYFFFENL